MAMGLVVQGHTDLLQFRQTELILQGSAVSPAMCVCRCTPNQSSIRAVLLDELLPLGSRNSEYTEIADSSSHLKNPTFIFSVDSNISHFFFYFLFFFSFFA